MLLWGIPAVITTARQRPDTGCSGGTGRQSAVPGLLPWPGPRAWCRRGLCAAFSDATYRGYAARKRPTKLHPVPPALLLGPEANI